MWSNLKRCTLLLLAGALLATVARADRPSPEERTGDIDLPGDIEQLRSRGLNPTQKGQFTFTGTVLSRDGSAVPGVEVKLFIGGLLVENHSTDSVGQYRFRRTIDFSRDETVILWLVDPSHALAPKAFVLKESESAQDNRLLTPCFPRLAVEQKIESTVYLFDISTKARQFVEKNCI